MKIPNRLLILLFALAIGCSVAVAQATEQHIVVTLKPGETPDEKVANSIKERELREAAETKRAAETAAKIAASNPKTLLAKGRSISITSSTSYFGAAQLQNSLMNNPDFNSAGVAIVDGTKGAQFADMLIDIDRPLFTFYFTYTITDRATGIVLGAGKITAFDGNAAAPLLARRIVVDIRKARGEIPQKK